PGDGQNQTSCFLQDERIIRQRPRDDDSILGQTQLQFRQTQSFQMIRSAPEAGPQTKRASAQCLCGMLAGGATQGVLAAAGDADSTSRDHALDDFEISLTE